MRIGSANPALTRNASLRKKNKKENVRTTTTIPAASKFKPYWKATILMNN